MEEDEENGDGLSSKDRVMKGMGENHSERDPAEFTPNEAYFSENE